MGTAQLPMEMDAAELRRRFDHGVRTGSPHWIWPEVPVEEWSSAVATIERMTSDVLAFGQSSVALNGRAEAVSVAALTTGMGPLLGYWLREGKLSASADAAAVLDLHLAHNTKRMKTLAAHAIRVVDHLARRGIETTVLKGMHTAFEYFPHPGTRPMADIDLLVDPAADSAGALGDLGFEPCGRTAYPEQTWRLPGVPTGPRNLFFVHEDSSWSIDLHLTLDLNATSAAPPVRLDLANQPGGARWALSDSARPLRHPALLMHLASHAGIHLISLTLVRLTELILLIRKDTESGALSWDEVRAAAQRIGALGLLYPALSLCERLVPGTVPEAIVRACRESAPPAAVRLIDSLTPATAHGVLRCSVEERFMWLPSRAMVAKQALYDLLPLKRSVAEVLPLYRMLAWRVLRRTVTR